jgi:holo-ACP synthase
MLMLSTNCITLDQMLRAREERVAWQIATLAQFGKPLISVTLVIPGPIKDGPVPRRAMEAALRQLDASLAANNWPLISREVLWRNTGPEAIYVVDIDAQILKSATIDVEEGHPIGRIWDLDVITTSGAGLSRAKLARPARRCLICNRPARECGRSRRHPLGELLKTIHNLVDDFDLHTRT